MSTAPTPAHAVRDPADDDCQWPGMHPDGSPCAGDLVQRRLADSFDPEFGTDVEVCTAHACDVDGHNALAAATAERRDRAA